ncbi:unnamed protein product [Bursaphelenchus xylophilus]|uniref:(pine wood nematode) hypothetical protein n=1 Tax=Bursaphelenchus xylophilus TaxID=6326 RepID=A0A1I7RH64_BURXY|nr:unnamed protein product [Bursaphelenchus xylophilus]CAG9115961.1 unnamed protein product [Bursaphelenchus xylophilus]
MYGARVMPACFECYSVNRPRKYPQQNDVDFLSELRNLEKELFYAKVEGPKSSKDQMKRGDVGQRDAMRKEYEDNAAIYLYENKTEKDRKEEVINVKEKMSSTQKTKRRPIKDSEQKDKVSKRCHNDGKKIHQKSRRVKQCTRIGGSADIISSSSSRCAFRASSFTSIHSLEANTKDECKKEMDSDNDEEVDVSPKVAYFQGYAEHCVKESIKPKPVVYGTWEARECFAETLRSLSYTVHSMETLRQVGPRSNQDFFDGVVHSLRGTVEQLSDLQYRYDHDANNFQKSVKNQYWYSK